MESYGTRMPYSDYQDIQKYSREHNISKLFTNSQYNTFFEVVD